MIDILIPVLGRPHRAAPLVENIRAVTEVPHRIWFLVSPGDEEQIAACAQTDALIKVMEFSPTAGDFAKKINYGYGMAVAYGCEWVFMGADDLTFHPRWDTTALKVAGDKFHVVGTNDRANASVRRGDFGTHCLIRRRYITEQGGTADKQKGVVLHEGYDHNFVDRELCGVARHRGVYAHAHHSIVKHNHPFFSRVPSDPTYAKGVARFKEDQLLFLKRARKWEYAGLSAHERKLAR